nr:hypothetical protein [Tanacetum cinerariifolium]
MEGVDRLNELKDEIWIRYAISRNVEEVDLRLWDVVVGLFSDDDDDELSFESYGYGMYQLCQNDAPYISSLTIEGELFLLELMLLNVSSLLEVDLKYSISYEEFVIFAEETFRRLLESLGHVKHITFGDHCLELLSPLKDGTDTFDDDRAENEDREEQIASNEKQITDVLFESMSFVQFREVIVKLVQGLIASLYYCKVGTPLRIEHSGYDALDIRGQGETMADDDGNESSDVYCCSDEEDLSYVDFHTEVVDIKTVTTNDLFLNKLCADSAQFIIFVDEPVNANVETDWNKMEHVLRMRFDHPEQLKMCLANYEAKAMQLWEVKAMMVWVKVVELVGCLKEAWEGIREAKLVMEGVDRLNELKDEMLVNNIMSRLDCTNKEQNDGYHLQTMENLWTQHPQLIFSYDGAISWGRLECFLLCANLEEDMIDKILSRSPCLESLELNDCYGYRRIDITSKSVKKLVFSGYNFHHGINAYNEAYIDCGKIDAPYISSLTIIANLVLREFVLLNVLSLVETHLDYWMDYWIYPNEDVL